jgi:hypothetical protein
MAELDNNSEKFVKNDEKSGLRISAQPRFCGYIKRVKEETQYLVSLLFLFLRKPGKQLFGNYGF